MGKNFKLCNLIGKRDDNLLRRAERQFDVMFKSAPASPKV